MSFPKNTGNYSLTITGTKDDINEFIYKYNDEGSIHGLSKSCPTPTGHYICGCENIELLRKALEQGYSKSNWESSTNAITYTLLWHNKEDNHCGFDYHNGISLTHYETTTEGRYKKDYESMMMKSTLKGKLAEFMMTQDIPEEDVPLERTGACGLPRVSEPEPEMAPKQVSYRGMDEANQKAMNVWATQGESAMLKHIMTGEDGSPISYAQSRMLYG